MPTLDGDDLTPRPMTANPGGQVAIADHVGHGAEYLKAMKATTGSGVLLTGDRRMGKTSLLSVLEAELKAAGHVVIRLSAETSNLDEFAKRLLDAIQKEERFRNELKNWSVGVEVEKYGLKLKRESPKPKVKSTHSDDLFTWAVEAAKPARLVVILDEITVLAHAMQKQDSDSGVEFLRSLRRARQLPNGPIMLFAGSIGIHHALADLTPVNDLVRVPVGRLANRDANFLARCLLLGEKVACANASVTAQAIVEQTDGIAFYVHHVVNDASLSPQPLDEAGVEALVEAALTNPDDPWDLGHYERRLSEYYEEEAPTVELILDELARSTSLTVDEIATYLAAAQPETRLQRTDVVKMIKNLERDHYLKPMPHTRSEFASELLRRAWKAIRKI